MNRSNAMRISSITLIRLAAVAAVTSLPLLTGCANDAQGGALLGAAIGALAGQAIGGDTEATLIGAGIGTAAGYAIGNESDKDKSRRYGNYDY